MPLYSIQPLGPGAALGLWQLRETPAELWARLPHPAHYGPRQPATADARRLAQWLAGRVLLHELLAQAAPPAEAEHAPRVVNDEAGRPGLLHWPAAAVSLSHSGDWVAALLAPHGRVGIDVEQVRDKARRLAPKFLSDAEHSTAQAHAEEPAFFSLLWSAKETLYKLAGQRGLIFKEQLRTTAFALAEQGIIPAELQLGPAVTRHQVCYSRPAPGYVLTYCWEPANLSFISS